MLVEDIIRDYAAVYVLKERKNILADFSKKPGLDSCMKYASYMQKIFLRELIAFSMWDDPGVGLSRTIALILVDGLYCAQEGALANVQLCDWIVRGDDGWGDDIFDEYKMYRFENDEPSEEFVFAMRCRATEEKWANPECHTDYEPLKLTRAAKKFLKNTRSLFRAPRKGWKQYEVKYLDRELDTNPDHTVAAQILAMAMHKTFDSECYYFDSFERVLLLLLVDHLKGDVPLSEAKYDPDAPRKERDEYYKLCSGIRVSDMVLRLLDAIRRHKEGTEAKFAYDSGKLETDFQARAYEGKVDLDDQWCNPAMNNSIIRGYLKDGDSFSEMWIHHSQDYDGLRGPFMAVTREILKRDIMKDVQAVINGCTIS